MGLNRVQLSLLVPDADMYEELVLPLKNSRELAPLILRMLSVYYKDESVRNVIDGFSDSLDTDVESVAAAHAEKFKAATDAMAMMSVMAEQLNSIAENGIDDMVSRMNDIATASGGEVAQDSDFGMSMPTFGNALPDLLAAKCEEAKQVAESKANVAEQGTANVGNVGNVADLDAIVSATVDKKMEAMTSELNTQKQALNSIQAMLQQLLNGNQTMGTNTAVEQPVSVPENAVVQEQSDVEEPVSVDETVVVEEQEEVVAPPPSMDIDIDLFSEDSDEVEPVSTNKEDSDTVDTTIEENNDTTTTNETETIHDKDSLLDFISEGGAFSFNIT